MKLMRERLGVFIGFENSPNGSSGRVLIPYSESRMPLRGTLLVVRTDDLHGRDTVQVGRVTGASALGDLISPQGEEYLNDLLRLRHRLPEDVKAGRLRYSVGLRLLGQVSRDPSTGFLSYSPAIRQLPHVGADVGFPIDELGQFIARGCPRQEEDPGPIIGHVAVGDLVMDGGDQAKGRRVPVHFRMESLVGRRTAVFARAGMGKSNFTKVLLSRLYQSLAPAQAPGTLIIDPEGEYAFSNASEPGLLDVPGLEGKVVVFTDRADLEPRYLDSVRGDCRIDFSGLNPIEVVNNLLPEEKQEMVFANLLRGIKQDKWAELVKLLDRDRYGVSYAAVGEVIRRRNRNTEGADVIVGAIINNLVPPIERLHSSNSVLIAKTEEALRAGKIVILDVSMRAGTDARLLAGLVLQQIFSKNVAVFTRTSGQAPGDALIRCLAVLEEAQVYLGGNNAKREDSPYVRWFKEGRKFSLGSILVTQQPGAVGAEMISQCDNFFAFHLLNSDDLSALSRANLHYAGDVSQTIAQETIPGNCYLWSSRGLSMVTSMRVMHFGRLVEEAGRNSRPPEPVTLHRAPPTQTVSLPVRTLPPATGDAGRSYLVHATRRAIEENERVYIFGAEVPGAPAGDSSPMESIVTSYLMPALRRVLEEDKREGRLPNGVSVGGVTVAEVASALAAAQQTIPSPIFVQESQPDREHLVFHAGFIGPEKSRSGMKARLVRPN